MKDGRDILDVAAENTQLMTDSAVEEVRNRAMQIEAGYAGRCDYCDQRSPRLVQRFVRFGQPDMMLCARCRDELGVG